LEGSVPGRTPGGSDNRSSPLHGKLKKVGMGGASRAAPIDRAYQASAFKAAVSSPCMTP
jgi:hypothetical protein